VEEEAPEETQREEGAKVAKEAAKAAGAAKAVEAVEAVETAEQEEERVSLPLNPNLRRVRSRSQLLRRDQPSKISLNAVAPENISSALIYVHGKVASVSSNKHQDLTSASNETAFLNI